MPTGPYSSTGSTLKVLRITDHPLRDHANAFLIKNQGGYSLRGVYSTIKCLCGYLPQWEVILLKYTASLFFVFFLRVRKKKKNAMLVERSCQNGWFHQRQISSRGRMRTRILICRADKRQKSLHELLDFRPHIK